MHLHLHLRYLERLAAGEVEGEGADAKLQEMNLKYGKEGGGFDLDELDEDFDELGIEDEDGEE